MGDDNLRPILLLTLATVLPLFAQSPTRSTLVGLIGKGPASFAETSQKLNATDNASAREYGAINAKLWCSPTNPVACYNPDANPRRPAPPAIEANTKRLRDLVTGAVAAALSSPGASRETIIRTIRRVQSGDPDTRAWLKDEPPFAEFGRAGNTPVLVAGFSILRCGAAVPDSRPYVQFYAQQAGNWTLQGEAGIGLRGCSLSHVRFKPRETSKMLYFFSGKRYGDTGSRLRVQLFEFDGSEVRHLWSRDELVRGELTADGNRFSIEYDQCPQGQNWGCTRKRDSWLMDETDRVLKIRGAR